MDERERTRRTKTSQLAKVLLWKLRVKALPEGFWDMCRFRLIELLGCVRMEGELPAGMPPWSDLDGWDSVFANADGEAVLRYMGWRIVPVLREGYVPLNASALFRPTNRMWLMMACERLLALTETPVVRRHPDKAVQEEVQQTLGRLRRHYGTYGEVARTLGVDYRVVSRWVCGKANPSLGNRLRMQKLLGRVKRLESKGGGT